MTDPLTTALGPDRGTLDTFERPSTDLGSGNAFAVAAQSGVQESLSGIGWRRTQILVV